MAKKVLIADDEPNIVPAHARARRMAQHQDRHTDRKGARRGGEQGTLDRRRSLHHQAVLHAGTDGTNKRAAGGRGGLAAMHTGLKFAAWLGALYGGVLATAAVTVLMVEAGMPPEDQAVLSRMLE